MYLYHTSKRMTSGALFCLDFLSFTLLASYEQIKPSELSLFGAHAL